MVENEGGLIGKGLVKVCINENGEEYYSLTEEGHQLVNSPEFKKLIKELNI